MNRRSVLKSGIAGVGALAAGCLGDDDGSSDAASGGGESEEGKHVVWNGDVLEIDSVRCTDPQGNPNFVATFDVTDPDDGIDFRVGEYPDDGIYVVQLAFLHEDENERYQREVDIDSDIEFEEDDFTSGSASLEPTTDVAEDTAPDGGDIEWDLAC